jgi:hypothetical protein
LLWGEGGPRPWLPVEGLAEESETTYVADVHTEEGEELKNDMLTVKDVLETRAEYDHELPVRSIGPALVLVLEREAPLRMETLASTDNEFDVLREECYSNPRWKALLDLYFEIRTDEEGVEHSDLWRREDDHADRLEAGQKLSSVRVT